MHVHVRALRHDATFEQHKQKLQERLNHGLNVALGFTAECEQAVPSMKEQLVEMRKAAVQVMSDINSCTQHQRHEGRP